MKSVKLYHGTTANISVVDLKHAKSRKDFGLGFYTTSDINQAIAFAKTLQRSEIIRGSYNVEAYVYYFNVMEADIKTLKVHKFEKNSMAWLDYILKNRLGKEVRDDYDIVIGQVADARAQEVINSYLIRAGYNLNRLDRVGLLNNLNVGRLSDQYCFKSERAIDILNKHEIGKRRRV